MYNSIIKKQLRKQAILQQPLLGNGSADTFPRQGENTIMEETVSVRSVTVLYNEDCGTLSGRSFTERGQSRV
jgi:hypothetical protein